MLEISRDVPVPTVSSAGVPSFAGRPAPRLTANQRLAARWLLRSLTILRVKRLMRCPRSQHGCIAPVGSVVLTATRSSYNFPSTRSLTIYFGFELAAMVATLVVRKSNARFSKEQHVGRACVFMGASAESKADYLCMSPGGMPWQGAVCKCMGRYGVVVSTYSDGAVSYFGRSRNNFCHLIVFTTSNGVESSTTPPSVCATPRFIHTQRYKRKDH